MGLLLLPLRRCRCPLPQHFLRRQLDQSPGEQVIAYLCLYLIPGVILFVFVYFIVAILLPVYRYLRKKRAKYPTVAQDLRVRIKWWFQKVWNKAPTNKRSDAVFDWVLRPEVAYTWWYAALYNAVVRSVAMVSGRALHKKHPMQAQAHKERVVMLFPEKEGGAPGVRTKMRFNLRRLTRTFEDTLGRNLHLRKDLFLMLNLRGDK